MLFALFVGFATVPATADTTGASTVTLLSQSTAVVAEASGSSPFSMVMTLPAGASVSTTLYGALTTRSGFLAALGPAGPSQPLTTTKAVAADCLPLEGTGRRLTIDVLTGSGTPTTTPCAGGPIEPSWPLRCTVGSGSCNGVYPVVVTITEPGATLAHFTTFLTFVETPARQPLRAAVVTPLGSASTSLDVTRLAGALRTERTVPLDVVVSPSTVSDLATTSSGTAALTSLAKVVGAGTPAHELVASPFVSVDPGQLAASGLGDQIHRQLARGQRALRSTGLDGASAQAGWLATSPVTSTTTTGLNTAGITRLVIPDSSLATPTSTSLTWGEPFAATPGSSNVKVLAADGALSAQMLSGSQPVLAAEHLLADLAFLHFERPSLSAPQGVVIEPGSGWRPNQAFLKTLLGGLRANPLVAPATLSTLFDQLTAGANGTPITRSLSSSAPSTPWPSSQVGQLRGGQASLRSFAASLNDGQSAIDAVALAWLRAESDTLSSSTRQAALDDASSTFAGELSTVGISGGDITLTSLKGAVPITLTKTSPWTLHGVLVVRGDHLRFPHGGRFAVVIDHPTQSIRIPVAAETTGDLALSAQLTTSNGAVVVTHERIVVHTTQTSFVAIVLTVGAAAVLGAWWIRTYRRERRQRR